MTGVPIPLAEASKDGNVGTMSKSSLIGKGGGGGHVGIQQSTSKSSFSCKTSRVSCTDQ